jgi:hypothetical protein
MTMSYAPDMTIPSLDSVWCSMFGRGSDASDPMTQSCILLVRLLAIAWCGAHPLATAGCARHKPAPAPAPAPAPEPRVPVALRVTNSNWSDVRIYVIRGTMRLRLGTVTTNSTVDFTIPADFLSGAVSVTLVADPVAGRASWTTPLPVATAGDEFELVVENFLQYSHLVVR